METETQYFFKLRKLTLRRKILNLQLHQLTEGQDDFGTFGTYKKTLENVENPQTKNIQHWQYIW